MRLFIVATTVLLVAAPAFADCSNPSAPTGKLIYNTTFDVFQGCAATGEWLAFSGSGQPGPQGPPGPQGNPGLDGDDAPADNLGDHVATTVLRSDTHNTDDLGTTAIRWKDGWFAGTVSATAFAGDGSGLAGIVPTPPNCTGADQALQWNGSSWSCATISGGLTRCRVEYRTTSSSSSPTCGYGTVTTGYSEGEWSDWSEYAQLSATSGSPSPKQCMRMRIQCE